VTKLETTSVRLGRGRAEPVKRSGTCSLDRSISGNNNERGQSRVVLDLKGEKPGKLDISSFQIDRYLPALNHASSPERNMVLGITKEGAWPGVGKFKRKRSRERPSPWVVGEKMGNSQGWKTWGEAENHGRRAWPALLKMGCTCLKLHKETTIGTKLPSSKGDSPGKRKSH